MRNILVFDIGGTSIKYGKCMNGVLDVMQETPTNASLGGRHIMNTLFSIIEKESAYDAIGISTAGQVDASQGTIIYANSNIPKYTGTKLRDELEHHFMVPVMVENDVNCAAMGEAIYGTGKDFESFLCLTYGTGIGGAIVLDKRIYHGSSFSAGEFGAIVTHGSENACAKDFFDGCYERYASTTALVEKVSRVYPDLTNGRRIFEQLGNPSVKTLVDEWIDEIILGLISVIHIFNPACIVLGGGIMVQPYITEGIQKKLYSRIMPSFSHVQIHKASLGNSAGLLGIHYLTKQYLQNK